LTKPNVLLISLDTLRFDCVGAIGEKRFLGDLAANVKSPEIDGFAKDGVVFTQAVSAAPFTTPSHASIFTGLWPTRHRAHHQYKTPIATQARTLAERLAASGYRTAQSAGRTAGEGVMFASEVTGLQRGFESSIFAGTVDKTTRRWIQGPWWSRRNRPWFLFFHTFAAHWPYGLEPSVVEAMFATAWETDDWTAVRRLYVENAMTADRMVGELLRFLSTTGQLDETIVVILADHGEGLGHLAPLHGPINGGREEVIRVPLLIGGPKSLIPNPVRVSSQVRTVDILPTILELCDVPAEAEELPLAGASLVPLIRMKPDSVDRMAFFAGHLNDDPLGAPLLAGARTERWKLIVDDCSREKLDLFEARLARQGTALKADLRGRLLREMFEAAEPVKLYDLEADPLEARNVAAEHPEVVRELMSFVEANIGSGDGSGDEGESNEVLEEQLRALGYLT
jgi:arylsulfatase A-like enzyme